MLAQTGASRHKYSDVLYDIRDHHCQK